MLKRWLVLTPEYGVVIPVLDYGQGPVEYGCDGIEIEAETRRDAISLGVREMLKGGKGGHGRGMRYQWCRDQRSDGVSPYAGVTAIIPQTPCLVCEGTGDGEIHGVSGECNACNGTGEGKMDWDSKAVQK